VETVKNKVTGGP